MKSKLRVQAQRPNRSRSSANAKLSDFDMNGDNDNRQRARQHKSALSRIAYLHSWVAISSLGQLSRTPFSTLSTAAVIAIALSFPAGLYVLLTNVKSVVSNWDNTHHISLFLKSGVDEVEALKFAKTIQAWGEIEHIEYISPQQALIEFRRTSGFGTVIDGLSENPLPAVIIVQPVAGLQESQRISQLAQKLRSLEQVDIAQLDMQWLDRLIAIIRVGERGLLLLTMLLGVAVLLIVGNTIRLIIYNRREEILVSKLIGATNRFIRRPFLYCGFWYGLTGASMAWVLLEILLALLDQPVTTLANLYNSQYHISALSIETIAIIILLGVGLGIMGSALAVGRHLHAIEPK